MAKNHLFEKKGRAPICNNGELVVRIVNLKFKKNRIALKIISNPQGLIKRCSDHTLKLGVGARVLPPAGSHG